MARIDVDQNLIKQYINVTGIDEEVAKNMLEACNGNLELAINMFLEGSIPGQIPTTVTHAGSSSCSDSSSGDSSRAAIKTSGAASNQSDTNPKYVYSLF